MSNEQKMEWLIKFVWRQQDNNNAMLEQRAQQIYNARLQQVRIFMCGA